MMKICVLLIFFYNDCLCVSGAVNDSSCASNKCYQSVNTTHEELLKLIDEFNVISSSAKISKPYDVVPLVKILIKESEHLGNETRKINFILNDSNNRLKEYQTNTTEDQKIVDHMFEKLANLSQVDPAVGELNKTLVLIKKQYNNLKQLIDLGQNASETCEQTNKKYKKFENATNTLSNSYDAIKKSYNNIKSRSTAINKNLNETFQETLKSKNDLERLKLPDNVVENYMIDLETKLNQSINYLKDNANILKELLEASYENMREQIRIKSEEVREKLSELQEDLSTIKENLKKFTFIKYEFTPTVNNESLSLIDEIRTEIEALENRIKLLEFTDQEKEVLSPNYFEENFKSITEKRLKLQEYRLFLNVLPDSKQLQEIEREITNFKITISLLLEERELEDQLKNLRRWRDEYLRMDCTTNNDGGPTILT